VRNPTVTPKSFAQWLSENAQDAIALPRSSDNAPRRQSFALTANEQRIADLAADILEAAIKLTVMVETVQKEGRVQYKREARVRTRGPADG
jgi:hypothetical protein